MNETQSTPRDRFLAFVRGDTGADPICSPFLPHFTVIRETLRYLGEDIGTDDIRNEAKLARLVGYEPMFMAQLTELIFDWREDPGRSTAEWEVSTIDTSAGEWVRKRKRGHDQWNDEAGCPVQHLEDHAFFRRRMRTSR